MSSKKILYTEFLENAQSVQLILDLGLPFPGLCEEEEIQHEKEKQEKEKETEKEEVAVLKCGVCKADWQLPKKAVEALQQKGVALPSACKQCQRKKNIQTGWK